MLVPEYLEQLPKPMVELYSQVEMDILMDMARRINTYDYYIPAAEHQRRKLLEMGMLHDEINKVFSQISGRSEEELKTLMKEAGIKTLEDDDQIYRASGLDPVPLLESAGLKQVLDAGYRKTNITFKNLTATTANTATKQFENALDRAWLQIQSGGFDSNTAVRNAVKDLSRQGVGMIRYPTGHIDTIEVAVRRAVVTGVNKTCAEVQLGRAEEMGFDLVEVSAHAGARPDHAVWQGKIYSRSGKSKKYPDFVSSTDYGSGAGLCGWNCRHNFRPYLEGSPRTYSDELLESYDEKKYTYNGKRLTEHEALQGQRQIERNIRRWKREHAAMAAAGLDTSEASAKVAKWQSVQRDYLKQTGLKRQYDRENAEKTLDNANRSGKIKEITAYKSIGAAAKKYSVKLAGGKQHSQLSEGQKITGKTFAGKGTKTEIRERFRLESDYRIPAGEWEKVSGKGYVVKDGKNVLAELHWYEAEGEIYEMKVKRYLDED